MKPASIYTLLHVLAEIAEAEQMDSERVQAEIEKAPTIEALAEALTSWKNPKCCKRETSEVRISDSSLSFPSVKDGTFSFVISKIEVVRTAPTELHLYVSSGQRFSFGEGYYELAPSVFKQLIEYFTD
jgi:hypothetical protein